MRSDKALFETRPADETVWRLTDTAAAGGRPTDERQEDDGEDHGGRLLVRRTLRRGTLRRPCRRSGGSCHSSRASSTSAGAGGRMDPFGELDLGLGPENATCYPQPGEILLYPGGVSETEILLAYGCVSFASKAGQLAGNHFATIVEGNENLRPLGRVSSGKAPRTSRSPRNSRAPGRRPRPAPGGSATRRRRGPAVGRTPGGGMSSGGRSGPAPDAAVAGLGAGRWHAGCASHQAPAPRLISTVVTAAAPRPYLSRILV